MNKCPVCWEEKEYSQGGWLHFDYGEVEWVCSQECVDLINFNWETWGEFYHNFVDAMFGLGDFYGTASQYCSFIEWLINKPKCDTRRVGGYHNSKRHSEDSMKDSKSLELFIETLRNKKALGKLP